jgi:hypothetical protein
LTVIESAVTTGLEAARVIVERRGFGRPVEITEPDASLAVGALSVWLRYAWAPSVFAASAWSRGSDHLGWLRRLLTPDRPPARQRRES